MNTADRPDADGVPGDGAPAPLSTPFERMFASLVRDCPETLPRVDWIPEVRPFYE